MSKSKIIGWVIASPFILIAAGITFCEANKAYWDSKVKELCEKDGGVTIYEKVVIKKSDYPDMKLASTGHPILPVDRKATEKAPFFYSHTTEFIKRDFFGLDLMRHEQHIIRKLDNKSLSKKISYGRRGGDFPTGFEQSHISCDIDIKDLLEYGSTITVEE